MTGNLTPEQDIEVEHNLDERADHIPIEQLISGTVSANFFSTIHKHLIGRGTKLIVGPRGCGKTHMMRYTWARSVEDQKLPLAIYISFNRYYRLEPFLKKSPDATDLFHGWVLARVVQGVAEFGKAFLEKFPGSETFAIPFDEVLLGKTISKLERSAAFSTREEELFQLLSIGAISDLLEDAADFYGRKRVVLLLDDAALTLTPEYLYEFFDFVRVIRTAKISPKASVYPGTDFGPRFHADHEAEKVSVWLSVDDPNFGPTMAAIAAARAPDITVSNEIDEFFRYASFGVPRAYLTLIREFSRSTGTQSQQLNAIVERHFNSKREEYESLKIKLPRFATIIDTGLKLFEAMVREVAAAQHENVDKSEKQTIIGIVEKDIENNPLAERMVNMLIEAGMVYPHSAVSHGTDRKYQRYAPHLSALIAARAFSVGRGSSAKQTLEQLKAKEAKHPLRRSLGSLLEAKQIHGLALDLPPCKVCSTARLTDQQRFCHHCGAELTDNSTYTQCMRLLLVEVPGLTDWQRQKIGELDNLKTIEDLTAQLNPSDELRRIPRVGTRRASKIIDLVTTYVDEFLS